MTFGHERGRGWWGDTHLIAFPVHPLAQHQLMWLCQPGQGFSALAESWSWDLHSPSESAWPGHRLGGTFRGNTSWESALGSQNLNPPIDKEASLTTLINLFKQITFCDRPDGSRKAKGDHYFHFKLTSLLIRFWLFMLLGGLCQIRTVCVYLFIYLFICLSVCLFCTWHWNMTDPFTAHLYPNIRAQASQSSMEVDVDTFQPDSSRSDGAARSGLDFLALLNCGKFVSLEGRA